jgi:hypothetical protein
VFRLYGELPPVCVCYTGAIVKRGRLLVVISRSVRYSCPVWQVFGGHVVTVRCLSCLVVRAAVTRGAPGCVRCMYHCPQVNCSLRHRQTQSASSGVCWFFVLHISERPSAMAIEPMCHLVTIVAHVLITCGMSVRLPWSHVSSRLSSFCLPLEIVSWVSDRTRSISDAPHVCYLPTSLC